MYRSTNWLAASACLLGLLAIPAHADWRQDIGNTPLTGQGTATWFGIPLYEARLWAGTPAALDRPFALELRYLTHISRNALVETSIREMERIAGPIDAMARNHWIAAMNAAFVDVARGDRIVGVFTPDGVVRFYHNDHSPVEIADSRFAKLFAAIWLSPRSREAHLRSELLAAGTPTRTHS